MIQFNDDGTIQIEFPDGPVTVKPPKYGAFKRIRAERQRLADELSDKVLALPVLDSLPAAGDQSEGAQEIRTQLATSYRARLREVEDLTGETLAATWRLILLGHGDDFAGLADPAPPDIIDDWPAAMLVDAGEIESVNGVMTRTNEALLDRVFKHWGKVQSRSGPTRTPPT